MISGWIFVIFSPEWWNQGFELIWRKKHKLNHIDGNGLSFSANSDPKSIIFNSMRHCWPIGRPLFFLFACQACIIFQCIGISLSVNSIRSKGTSLRTFKWINMLCFFHLYNSFLLGFNILHTRRFHSILMWFVLLVIRITQTEKKAVQNEWMLHLILVYSI